MSTTRIWVTGIGLVTALGAGTEPTWKRLVEGERAIGPVTLFDTTGQRSTLAAQVPDVVLPTLDTSWSRTSAMALGAAKEALSVANLDVASARVGLAVGGTTGGMYETEALLAKLHADPAARDALAMMLSHPLTATGDSLASVLGAFARVRTVCSACSSGANALIVAAAWLLAGEVDAVVAGGTDGLCRLTYTGFNALGALSPEPCRPFDRARRGLTLGEGAGFVVLERAESARARGATPLAEFAGWATGAEAHHITNPDPTGQVVSRLMKAAIEGAGLSPEHIDYVSAHGTATPLNDPMEAAALARALGREIERIPISSSKAQIGHTLGAAGAIEGGIAALSVARQTLVPTAGLDDPDPACNLVHVPSRGRSARVRAALSNSFGFGGMDAVLLFTEPELGPPREAIRARVVITGVATLGPRGFAGARVSAELLDGAAEPLPYDVDAQLDAARARRLDHTARIGAAVTEAALHEANVDAQGRAETGVLLGSAFAGIDNSAAFMHRYYEKGPRLASPAEFPNLVPSSPAGHTSIYGGLRGPVFATADLSTSGESAIAQAAQLIAVGAATRIVAGSVEDKSRIVERVLAALFSRSHAQAIAPRVEGAAAVVLEDEARAVARGAKLLARVADILEWREGAPSPLRSLANPRERARVVLPRENGGIDALLEDTGWSRVARATCEVAMGEHDGLGAVAIAAAVGLLARGDADEVLVVGLGKGRGYALRLEACA